MDVLIGGRKIEYLLHMPRQVYSKQGLVSSRSTLAADIQSESGEDSIAFRHDS